ncbi:hypothetical protein MLD38_003864 [Melastoma candidum]|uniref:Uncharacterized protein n=1 Tax=Melastoma candidum TaxID=119954 RepID=A0ACB9S347_9MYRT|nr:hypothetical protein MLD38_003864 [Melastoma candidum]
MALTSPASSKLLCDTTQPQFSRVKPLPCMNTHAIMPLACQGRFDMVCVKSSLKYVDVLMDEEMDKIRRLQNGSDVRGVALEGETGRSVDLTPPAVEAITESFGEWVIRKVNPDGVKNTVRVSLGRDPRLSGQKLSTAVFAGLARAGCVSFDMGLATTPACFMSTVLEPFSYDASIMVSHHELNFRIRLTAYTCSHT